MGVIYEHMQHHRNDNTKKKKLYKIRIWNELRPHEKVTSNYILELWDLISDDNLQNYTKNAQNPKHKILIWAKLGQLRFVIRAEQMLRSNLTSQLQYTINNYFRGIFIILRTGRVQVKYNEIKVLEKTYDTYYISSNASVYMTRLQETINL